MSESENKSLVILYSSAVIKDEFAVHSLHSLVSIMQQHISVRAIDIIGAVRPSSPKSLINTLLEIRSIIRAARSVAVSEATMVLLYRPSFFVLLLGLLFMRNKEVTVDASGVPFMTAEKKTGLIGRLRKLCLQKTLRVPRRIVVSTTKEKLNVCSSHKVPAERVKVISKGIPAVLFQRLTTVRYKQPQNSITLTYAGPLNDDARVWSLLQAVEGSSHIKLNLIGDGRLYAAVRKYIRSKRIRNVSLYNTLTWKRKLPFYQTSSALVIIPGKADESSVPDELLEAAATGLPILFLRQKNDHPFLRRLKLVITVEDSTAGAIMAAVQRLSSETTSRSVANCALIYQRFLIERMQAAYWTTLNPAPEHDELLLSELSLPALWDSSLPA